MIGKAREHVEPTVVVDDARVVKRGDVVGVGGHPSVGAVVGGAVLIGDTDLGEVHAIDRRIERVTLIELAVEEGGEEYVGILNRERSLRVREHDAQRDRHDRARLDDARGDMAE